MGGSGRPPEAKQISWSLLKSANVKFNNFSKIEWILCRAWDKNIRLIENFIGDLLWCFPKFSSCLFRFFLKFAGPSLNTKGNNSVHALVGCFRGKDPQRSRKKNYCNIWTILWDLVDVDSFASITVCVGVLSAAFGWLLVFSKAIFSRARFCSSNYVCHTVGKSVLLQLAIALSVCIT